MKLVLKELSRKLLKHYISVAKVPLLSIENNQQVVFDSELCALPLLTSKASHILSFSVPSSTAAQISVGKQSYITLSENDSIMLDAGTHQLAAAVFSKAVRKQQR
jgi:hypothetical protein